MDSYQECEVCGVATDGRFFCEEHKDIIEVVEDALTTPNVVMHRSRWIAVKVSRYFRGHQNYDG